MLDRNAFGKDSRERREEGDTDGEHDDADDPPTRGDGGLVPVADGRRGHISPSERVAACGDVRAGSILLEMELAQASRSGVTPTRAGFAVRLDGTALRVGAALLLRGRPRIRDRVGLCPDRCVDSRSRPPCIRG